MAKVSADRARVVALDQIGLRGRPLILPSPGGGGSARIERSEMRDGVGRSLNSGTVGCGETVTPPRRSFHERRPSPSRGGLLSRSEPLRRPCIKAARNRLLAAAPLWRDVQADDLGIGDQ